MTARTGDGADSMIEARARAEALSRFPHPVDVLTGEPVDDWGYEEYARQAFIAGAIWQAESLAPSYSPRRRLTVADDVIEQARAAIAKTQVPPGVAIADAVAMSLADAGLLRQEPPTRDELDQVRAEERERIARQLSVEHAKAARNIKTRYGQGQIDAYADAARIAREAT